MASEIEEMLALHIRAEKLPVPEREAVLIEGRNWRCDFAWPLHRVVVEVEGEVHRIKTRFHADIEKHAALLLAGWTLLRVDGRMIRAGIAVLWIAQLLEMRRKAMLCPPPSREALAFIRSSGA